MSKIIVKQVRSPIGQPANQGRILRALGLRRIGKEKTFSDNNCIRGMVNKISHLVTYRLEK